MTARGEELHGGNIYRVARELGIPEGEVMDFSASINPLGPPPGARAEMRRPLEGLVHYPEPEAGALVREIALHHGVEPGRVLAGNGSTELIYLVPRALRPRTVLIPQPTFSEYERACALSGARIKRLALERESGYRVEPEEFITAMRGAGMAFLCNPNNPSGHALQRREVLEIARAARRLRCFLVVDEAFVDFCPEESVLGVEDPWLIVLRSMTKFHSLAGLRLGYGVAAKRVAARLRTHKEPWTVNTVAQRAGISALRDRDFRERTLRFMENERTYLQRGFEKLSLAHYPARANFHLLRIGPAEAVVEGLLQRSIAVRDCSNFRGLAPGHIRVAVRTRAENRKLLLAMRELL